MDTKLQCFSCELFFGEDEVILHPNHRQVMVVCKGCAKMLGLVKRC